MLEINKINSFSVRDFATGKVLLETNNVGTLDMSNDYTRTVGFKSVDTSAYFEFDNSFSFQTEPLSEDVINKLMGIGQTDPLVKIVVKGKATKLTQNRKHKKKRINKKWAKIYGFSEQTFGSRMEFDKCKITNMEDGLSTYEFEGEVR